LPVDSGKLVRAGTPLSRLFAVRP